MTKFLQSKTVIFVTCIPEYFCILKLFRKTFCTSFPISTGQNTHLWALPGSPLMMVCAPSFTLIHLTTLVFPIVVLPSVLSFLLYLRWSSHFPLRDYMQLSFMTQATLSVPVIELSVRETQFSSCLIKSKWNWLSLCVLYPVAGPVLFPILKRIPAGLSRLSLDLISCHCWVWWFLYSLYTPFTPFSLLHENPGLFFSSKEANM